MERYSELCKLSHHRLVQLVMRLEDDLLQATQEKAAAVDHYRTAFATERLELMNTQNDLFRERNRSAALSGTVIRKEREIAQLKAKIARLDDMLAPKLAIEIKTELEEKKSA